MTTDWRALCAELVKELDDLRESSEGVAGLHRNGDLAPWSELGESGEFPWLSSFDRARAALAEADGPAVPDGREPASVATQPSEPEAVGPTDEQLSDIADETPWRGSPRHFGREVARATLARWGRPAAAPVPVSERLPGPEDLNDKGECWEWDSTSDAWVLIRPIGLTFRTGPWLPANALPLPAPKGGEVQP